MHSFSVFREVTSASGIQSGGVLFEIENNVLHLFPDAVLEFRMEGKEIKTKAEFSLCSSSGLLPAVKLYFSVWNPGDEQNQGCSGVLTGDYVLVPGEGSEIVKLEYLGLGQHIALYPYKELNTMGEALDILGDCFQEPKKVKAKKKPVLPIPVRPEKKPAQSILVWSGDSKWLFGVRCVILNGLELGLIYNDPSLYGGCLCGFCHPSCCGIGDIYQWEF